MAHKFIGSFKFSINDLLNGKKRFELLDHKGKTMGTILFNIATIIKKYQFLDYLAGEMEMNLVVGVDWTASNKDPRLSDSLHYNAQGIMNEYECAIRSIGDILSYYDNSKQFPAYGFGGRLPNLTVSHCFALNGNPQQSACNGVDGVLSAYKQALANVELYGPTCFAPLLSTVREIARGTLNQEKQKYTILLLITDGVINDMDATLSTIVDLASLPVSVVIVGVGNADFAAMDILDSDGTRLFDGRRYAERDCVQFVPFRQFKNQPYAVLAKETLAEIPQQVTEYFSKRNIAPKPRPLLNIPSFFTSNDTNTSQPQEEVPTYNPNIPQQQQELQRQPSVIYNNPTQQQQAPPQQFNSNASFHHPQQQMPPQQQQRGSGSVYGQQPIPQQQMPPQQYTRQPSMAYNNPNQPPYQQPPPQQFNANASFQYQQQQQQQQQHGSFYNPQQQMPPQQQQQPYNLPPPPQ
jgi:hypothetical protein